VSNGVFRFDFRQAIPAPHSGGPMNCFSEWQISPKYLASCSSFRDSCLRESSFVDTLRCRLLGSCQIHPASFGCCSGQAVRARWRAGPEQRRCQPLAT
jgi:hypothetical protein